MLLILILILCVAYLPVLYKHSWLDKYANITAKGAVGITTIIIGFICLLLSLFCGPALYGKSIDLISQKQEVDTYCQSIDAVKDAYYKEANSAGNMIQLDNQKQSTNVSKTIQSCYQKKANFEAKLKDLQFRSTDPVQKYVFFGLFISKTALEQVTE